MVWDKMWDQNFDFCWGPDIPCSTAILVEDRLSSTNDFKTHRMCFGFLHMGDEHNLQAETVWVKQALSASLDQEEERSCLTREALSDVDAGRVIDPPGRTGLGTEPVH